METHKIHGVEIFSAGTWNGDEYSTEDLHEIVKAFDENKVGFRPFLKLGHDESQTLLQQDGYPAAGWVERIYVQGEKLMADFVDIPKKIFDLIKSKAYRKVSCEIYWNLKVNEKLYPKLLGAVALLGADNPGVMNLNDILGMYAKLISGETPKSYAAIAPNFEMQGGSGMEKTEKEIKLELEVDAKAKELEAKEAELKAFALREEEAKSELEKLREYKKASEQKEIELAQKLAEEKRESFMKDLEADKLCSPAMKPYVKALLGEEKKEYAIGDKTLSKEETLKEALKLFKEAASVNFEINTENKKDFKKEVLSKEEEEKVNKYMKEQGCTYGKALKDLGLNKRGA